jgi:hypothetical protein
VMMDSLGKLGTDPSAMSSVLDAFGDAIRGKVEIHNREVEGAKTNNVKFPYDPIIKIPPKPKKDDAPKNFPQPSQQAINRLKMKPAEREQFEAVFGPGSAARILGR